VVPPTGYVADVVNSFSNYIETAIKVPWRAASSKKSGAKVLINKSQKVTMNFFTTVHKLLRVKLFYFLTTVARCRFSADHSRRIHCRLGSKSRSPSRQEVSGCHPGSYRPRETIYAVIENSFFINL
jgi:hypothetical protein